MSTQVPELLKALRGIEQQLEQFRQSRQAALDALARRRDALASELAAVEADLAAVNSATAPAGPPAAAPAPASPAPAARGKGTGQGKPGRPTRGTSLTSVLTDVLKREGRPLSAQELADAALRAGVVTTSGNFKAVVWTALGTLKKAGKVTRAADQRWQLPGA